MIVVRTAQRSVCYFQSFKQIMVTTEPYDALILKSSWNALSRSMLWLLGCSISLHLAEVTFSKAETGCKPKHSSETETQNGDPSHYTFMNQLITSHTFTFLPSCLLQLVFIVQRVPTYTSSFLFWVFPQWGKGHVTTCSSRIRIHQQDMTLLINITFLHLLKLTTDMNKKKKSWKSGLETCLMCSV